MVDLFCKKIDRKKLLFLVLAGFLENGTCFCLAAIEAMTEALQASGRVKRYLSLAAREAHRSPMKFRHGAVLVKGGRLLSKGFNHYRKTIGGESYCSTHAEMDTLRRLGTHKESLQSSRGSDLFVVRMGKDGLLRRNSKPCPICVEWMHRYGVNRVYYTVGEQKNEYTYTDVDSDAEESGWWMEHVDDLKRYVDHLRESGVKFKLDEPVGSWACDQQEEKESEIG